MKQNHNFLSVIIPVYNDQKGIDKCIEALLSQNYPIDHFEIIIVDNASWPPIIKPSNSANVRLITCRIKGSYAARNAGIKEAMGDMLAFTDADCVPDKDWLFSGTNALNSCRRKCIIGGEVKMVLPDNPTSVALYQGLTGFMMKENIEQSRFTGTGNLFVRKEVFLVVGTFNEGLLSGGDREWCWRAGAAGYDIQFAADTVVITSPRKTIASAFRQATRVAGGRYMLQRMNSKHIQPSLIKPHRSSIESLGWIIKHQGLSFKDRMRVMFVAILIKFWTILESFRLKFMGAELRR